MTPLEMFFLICLFILGWAWSEEARISRNRRDTIRDLRESLEMTERALTETVKAASTVAKSTTKTYPANPAIIRQNTGNSCRIGGVTRRATQSRRGRWQ
jgi:hypothetical protein